MKKSLITSTILIILVVGFLVFFKITLKQTKSNEFTVKIELKDNFKSKEDKKLIEEIKRDEKRLRELEIELYKYK